MTPHFNFWTKQGPTVSVSNIMDIVICGCSGITWTRFHDFYCVCYNVWTIYGSFLSSYASRSLHVGPFEKVQYLKLEILKSFLLWIVRKKTTMNDSLRRYDTIKTCPWNFFKFSWVVHYREICENQVQKLGLTMLFSEFCRSQKRKYYKTWTYETVFIYILCFIFYGVSRAKTELHNKYIL